MKKIYTIHDSKGGFYLELSYFRSNGEAMRAFETTVRDPKSQFHLYPGDFTLIHLGEFDSDTSSISLLENPSILANGSDYKDQPAIQG